VKALKQQVEAQRISPSQQEKEQLLAQLVSQMKSITPINDHRSSQSEDPDNFNVASQQFQIQQVYQPMKERRESGGSIDSRPERERPLSKRHYYPTEETQEQVVSARPVLQEVESQSSRGPTQMAYYETSGRRVQTEESPANPFLKNQVINSYEGSG